MISEKEYKNYLEHYTEMVMKWPEERLYADKYYWNYFGLPLEWLADETDGFKWMVSMWIATRIAAIAGPISPAIYYPKFFTSFRCAAPLQK